MFKLLTEEERQLVQHEYLVRRFIVMLWALIIVLLVGIVGFLPSYILSNARQSEVLVRMESISKVKREGDEVSLKTWFSKMTSRLRVLSPALDTDRPSDFVHAVLEQKIPGMRITDFSWIRESRDNEKEKVVLSINGLASDRQTLLAFKDHINTSGVFSEVILPISDLAKDKDIAFQLKFSFASTSAYSKIP